jgi:hypothetical protein
MIPWTWTFIISWLIITNNILIWIRNEINEINGIRNKIIGIEINGIRNKIIGIEIIEIIGIEIIGIEIIGIILIYIVTISTNANTNINTNTITY